jgi:hypothetical protein
LDQLGDRLRCDHQDLAWLNGDAISEGRLAEK